MTDPGPCRPWVRMNKLRLVVNKVIDHHSSLLKFSIMYMHSTMLINIQQSHVTITTQQLSLSLEILFLLLNYFKLLPLSIFVVDKEKGGNMTVSM